MRLEREMLLRYHQKGDSGLRLTRARSVIMDVLIQNLFEYAMEIAEDTIGKTKPMCVMATGGYGRGELSRAEVAVRRAEEKEEVVRGRGLQRCRERRAEAEQQHRSVERSVEAKRRHCPGGSAKCCA